MYYKKFLIGCWFIKSSMFPGGSAETTWSQSGDTITIEAVSMEASGFSGGIEKTTLTIKDGKGYSSAEGMEYVYFEKK